MQVIVGDPTAFDVLAFGQASQSTVDYIQKEIARASTVLTEFGQQGFAAAKAVFERFHGEEAMRKAREISRKIGWVFKEDCIRPLTVLEELQAAMPIMQRWIMACPELRELHIRQECAGYATTYVDIDPGNIGDEHYDYRRVNEGWVRDEEDKPLYTLYYDDIIEGDRKLDVDEQEDIFRTWDAVRAIIKKGKHDPSSIHGDNLV